MKIIRGVEKLKFDRSQEIKSNTIKAIDEILEKMKIEW